MRNFLAIWRRDMAACFISPVAYVTMVVFLSLTGWIFMQMLEGHDGTPVPLSSLLIRVLVFFWLPILVTVITMRLFAEERRSGTIEVLMTAPVSEASVSLGKYAGALSFFVIVSLPIVWAPVVVAHVSPGIDTIDWGAMAGGGVIVLLLAAFCMAIGLLISMTTRNQIVAAIGTFCAVLLVLLSGHLIALWPQASERLVACLSTDVYVLSFARGIIDTRAIVLYLSGTCFVLFCAIRLLESNRWR